ncbi:hypothetical protein F-liban_171 [Faustovirus]|nr:hypothetical protein F-liban_171 [Faustovirus]
MARFSNNITYSLKDIPSMKFMFPDFGAKSADKGDLKITYEGIYSITSPKIMRIIINEINKRLAIAPSKITITDATANCGGSVLALARVYGSINAVEISHETMAVLQHNVGLYNITNVKFVESDYTKVMCDLKQDVVFIDPPWGGRGYDVRANIRLRLGDLSLIDIAKKLYLGKLTKLIVMKLPYNYDLTEFTDLEFSKIKIGNVLLVFISGLKRRHSENGGLGL